MRVLFITEWFLPDMGGSINWYYNTYKRFVDADVFVLTKETKGWREFDKTGLFQTHRVSFKGYRFLKPESLAMYLKLLFCAIWLALQKRIDIIHCDKVMPTGLIGYLVKKILNKPYIVYAHGEEITIYSKYKYKRKLMPVIYNSAEKVIANSSFTKKLLTDMGVNEEKIKIIHPGVDTEEFNPDVEAKEIIRRHNLQDRKVLLTVGRLQRRKGQDMVIKSLPRVIDKLPNLVYLIVGGGEEEQALKQLVKKLNLESYVNFVGYIEDGNLAKYYSASDLFIMANRELSNSDVEGFGIVFLEANACAKPVIGGKSGGTIDSIIHRKTGLLVNPNSEEEIANAIISILENKEYAKLLGQNGRQRVVNEFNWDDISRKIQDLSRSCINCRK